MKATRWRPVRKGSLLGFLSLHLDSGLVLRDCSVHRASDGRLWLGLPAKPQLDREGRQARDINGKRIYEPVVEIDDKARREIFQTQAVAAVTKLVGDDP